MRERDFEKGDIHGCDCSVDGHEFGEFGIVFFNQGIQFADVVNEFPVVSKIGVMRLRCVEGSFIFGCVLDVGGQVLDLLDHGFDLREVFGDLQLIKPHIEGHLIRRILDDDRSLVKWHVSAADGSDRKFKGAIRHALVINLCRSGIQIHEVIFGPGLVPGGLLLFGRKTAHVFGLDDAI